MSLGSQIYRFFKTFIISFILINVFAYTSSVINYNNHYYIIPYLAMEMFLAVIFSVCIIKFADYKRYITKIESDLINNYSNSSDAIMIVESGEFIYANRTSIDLFNQNILGLHPHDISPEFQKADDGSTIKSDELASRMLDIVLNEGYNRFRWIHIDSLGREFPAEVTLSLLMFNRKKSIVAVVRDITDLVKSEDILHNMIKETKDSNDAKSEFIASMSHEIRTPMNGIIGTAQIMEDLVDEGEQKELLSVILQSSHLLINIINDVLDFSKLEAGKYKLVPEVFELRQCILHVINLYRTQAEKKGVNLIYNIDDNMEIHSWLYFDQNKLKQVLNNLISNSIKFTESGYVELSVKLLGCVKDGINLSFSIHDSGVGISKDDQIGVFDKFTQVLDGKRHSINGTGLGLSIAKGIIDVMDGELLLDSSLGEGSTFSFQVCIPEANRKSVDLILSSGCVNTISFKGKHILIVEDNKVNQTVAKKLISKIGASFELAEDGKIAVDMLKKDPDAFDLILMDNQMPVMTGLEATDVIKNTLGIKTPIVLCTADITEETKLESERLSMDGYITKPFKIAKLSKVLKKAI